MSGVDWSKAPKWAETVISDDENNLYWAQKFGTYSFRQAFVPKVIGFEGMADMTKPNHGWTLIAGRPGAWTGEGLPPVGAVVQVKPMGFAIRNESLDFLNRWLVVMAVFTTTNGINMVAVDGGVVLGCEVFRAEMIFPAKTAEQIAVEEMLALDPPDERSAMGLTSRKSFCETLYRNGYRKASK